MHINAADVGGQLAAYFVERKCNGTRIPDPAPNLTVEQVREILTPSHPEIATASLSGPEDTGDALRYTFSRAIGSKG